MNIDKVTLDDLSFLQGEHSVFSLIKEGCITQEGTTVLKQHIQHPPDNFVLLHDYQDAVRFWIDHTEKWTKKISNGTIVMVQKFYETADLSLEKPNEISLFFSEIMQKLFHKKGHSFELFSISHLTDFLKGCFELSLLLEEQPPQMVVELLTALKEGCQRPLVQQIIQTHEQTTHREWLDLGYQSRKQIRSLVYKMIQQFAALDALHAMALATQKNNWQLPELLPETALKYEVHQLVHPLIKNPTGYDLSLNGEQRFLFLTGANMSGKSTLLYALGIGALLAHLGMGVPAQKMQISFLKGIITNMHIEDNVLLGESYFFAEVQRMKHTAQKLKDSPYHLVLMDELFKGTNGYDAYECSYAVIKGLLGRQQNLMALSTHLSELSEKLKAYREISFHFCQTNIDDKGKYHFTYQLKEGVSNDRIGFLVLKKEGVLDLLEA